VTGAKALGQAAVGEDQQELQRQESSVRRRERVTSGTMPGVMVTLRFRGSSEEVGEHRENLLLPKTPDFPARISRGHPVRPSLTPRRCHSMNVLTFQTLKR
jgi:hypothetical protein